MKQIPLTQNKFAVVDDADFDWLNQWKWHALYVPKRDKWYAARRDGKRGPYLYMHRVILNTPKGLDTDHKDGDGLHNWRGNLRAATRVQNCANRRKKVGVGSSQYKGVHRYGDNGKFKVDVRENGIQRHVGVFDNEVDAAIAYDREVTRIHGEFAVTNFPQTTIQ